MQLNKMVQTNLFNELSDKEQEVVAGGTTYSGAWGTVKAENGSFQYTGPNGEQYPAAKWSGTSFSYGNFTYNFG